MRYILLLLFALGSITLEAQQSAQLLEQRMSQVQGEDLVRVKIELGNMYVTSNPERGLELGLEAAFLSKRLGSQLLEGQALLLMGLSSFHANQTENALRYYNRALNHFEKFSYTREQITALEGISEIYSSVRNYEMASSYLVRAIRIAQSINDRDLQIALHRQLGNIYLNQNSFTRAYQEFSKVNEILGDEAYLSTDDLQVQSETYRKIGLVYRNLGQFEQSLLAFRKAAAIGSNVNLTDEQMADNLQIAFSLYLLEQLDSALIYYNKVLAHYQLQNDTIPVIEVLIDIGDVFFEKKQYRQAVASFNRAFQYAQSVGLLQEQVTALVNISRCYGAFGDYPSSTDYLNQALEIATRENLTTSAAEVYRYLSQVYEEEGRFSQALDYYKLWAELRDSIYSEESGQKLARMQILYEYDYSMLYLNSFL